MNKILTPRYINRFICRDSDEFIYAENFICYTIRIIMPASRGALYVFRQLCQTLRFGMLACTLRHASSIIPQPLLRSYAACCGIFVTRRPVSFTKSIATTVEIARSFNGLLYLFAMPRYTHSLSSAFN